MRPINLIPPDERRGDRAPLRAGALSYVVLAALALAFVGVYMLVSTGNSISEREAEVAGLEDQLASTQARAEALQSFTNFALMEKARTETVSSLAHSRFDWERVMRELALVIPSDVSLTTLSGSVSGGDGGSQSSSSGGIDAPSLTMAGCASGHESVARMIAALRDIDGVTRVGLQNTDEGSDDDSTSTPSTTSGESGEECPGPDAASFEATVAFDEVEVDSASGGSAPPSEEPTPAEGDGSGVAEAEQERDAAKGSVEKGKRKSDKAVDRFVPGA